LSYRWSQETATKTNRAGDDPKYFYTHYSTLIQCTHPLSDDNFGIDADLVIYAFTHPRIPSDGAGPQIPLTMFTIVHSAIELIKQVCKVRGWEIRSSCLTRSILAPTNKQINKYNAFISEQITGVQNTYYSYDTAKEAEDANFPDATHVLDYAASHDIHGIPPYKLDIKVNGISFTP
jgi:hypothetical protein